jgi:hypothetical protein
VSPHQALLPRSFSQIEPAPLRELCPPQAQPSGGLQRQRQQEQQQQQRRQQEQQQQEQELQQQRQQERRAPHSPSVQHPVNLDYTPSSSSAPGALPAAAGAAAQERFASPADTKAKLDLRKTALLRSLLIRTESNAKQLEAVAAEGWMDDDDDYGDDPMALSPTPELPEVCCRAAGAAPRCSLTPLPHPARSCWHAAGAQASGGCACGRVARQVAPC